MGYPLSGLDGVLSAPPPPVIGRQQLRGGWYGSCVHAGGLSCLGKFLFRRSQFCKTDLRNDKYMIHTKTFRSFVCYHIVSFVHYSGHRLTTPLCVSLFWSTRCTLTMWYVKSISSYLLCWPSKYTMVQPAQFKPSPNSCLKS